MQKHTIKYSNTFVAFVCVFFLGLAPNSYAQKTHKITYGFSEIKPQGNVDSLSERSNHFTRMIIERSKDVNYTLFSNKENSYFEEEETLLIESDSRMESLYYKAVKQFTSFNEEVYTNHRDKKITFIKNLVSQNFTIKRDYYNFNWVIKDDQKRFWVLLPEKQQVITIIQ